MHSEQQADPVGSTDGNFEIDSESDDWPEAPAEERAQPWKQFVQLVEPTPEGRECVVAMKSSCYADSGSLGGY